MLTRERRKELVLEAERVVNRLRTSDVGRTELSPVTNVLFHSHGTWPERFKRAHRIAKRLPGSWMSTRGNDGPAKARRVSDVMIDLLARFTKEEEMRYLLGWATRRLFVEESQARTGGR